VNAQTVSGALLTIDDAGAVTLESAGLASLILDDGGAGVVTLKSGGASQLRIDGGNGTTGDVHINGATVVANGIGGVTLSAGQGVSVAALNLLNAGQGPIILQTASGAGADIEVLAAHDETHTAGRNFSLTAQGSGGASVTAEIGNITLQAGTVDGTGVVRIQPGTAAAGRQFQIFNGVGHGYQTCAAPTGGAVIDAECRASLLALAQLFSNWGFLDMV